MKFRNLNTGLIYDVTNETLIPQYEKSELFEAVKQAEAVAEAPKPKKATAKKSK